MEAKQLEEGDAAFLNPITHLENGAWPLARVDLPNEVLFDARLLRLLEIIDSKGREINQMIQSRENFRIQHVPGDPGFLTASLLGFRRIIDYPLEDLSERIEEVLPQIMPLAEGRRDRWLAPLEGGLIVVPAVAGSNPVCHLSFAPRGRTGQRVRET
jgi:hypothetical protein